MNSFFAVGVGAALGAWVRWGLGLLLNALHPALPIGTLIANLVGAYLMGVLIALFAIATPSSELRLLLTTGFLGGLTTFSTFSGEAFTLFQRHQYAWAAMHISCHVIGSLIMTALGFMTIQWLRTH
ncbi:MAG: fluoride efflux transporter CrcB [Methylophilaceae bacterium]|nr:fluoride efflux transporter CrcB [Methylophilaceae bacterium]